MANYSLLTHCLSTLGSVALLSAAAELHGRLHRRLESPRNGRFASRFGLDWYLLSTTHGRVDKYRKEVGTSREERRSVLHD